jgi:hypothetical protein
MNPKLKVSGGRTPWPARMDLFSQSLDLAGQLMGGYAHACQALLFQEVDLVNRGSHLRSFDGVGSSPQVPWNSRSQPMKEGRMGSWFSQ